MDGKRKEQTVRNVFERISGIYDRANMRISLGMQKRWKRLFVRQILALTPEKGSVLDVCCGTGDIALALAAGRPGLRAAGVDFSEAMLRVARRREAGQMRNRLAPDPSVQGKGQTVIRRNRPGKSPAPITWLHGNAMFLPFGDSRFAAAAISFGLRNTADYEQVLREMKRVVKPGGYIFCLDSFVPEVSLVKPFYKLYFCWLMPLLGGGRRYFGEYCWLWRSTRDFLTKTELFELMERTGLKDVTCRSFFFGTCIMHWGRNERDCASEIPLSPISGACTGEI